jgi:hypothetical protein
LRAGTTVQIVLDDKTLAMLGTAVVSLCTAVWAVSRSYTKLQKVDQIEKEFKAWKSLLGPLVTQHRQIWQYLGFSERRLQAQRPGFTTKRRGPIDQLTELIQVELLPPKTAPPPPAAFDAAPAPESEPEPEPEPPPKPPRYHSLIGPADPFSIPPPPHPATTTRKSWEGKPIRREDVEAAAEKVKEAEAKERERQRLRKLFGDDDEDDDGER